MSEIGQSNEVVAKRVLDGDIGAFGAFFDKYSDLVFGIACHYTRNRCDAMDIAQEVFIKAFRSIGEIRDFTRFPKWLARTTISQSLNWLRDNKRYAATVGGDTLKFARFATPGTGSPQVPAQKIWDAIDKLPESCRIVVMLKYFDGLPYTEIAEVIGVSLAAVRNRMFRAKKRLKGILATQIECRASDKGKAATA